MLRLRPSLWLFLHLSAGMCLVVCGAGSLVVAFSFSLQSTRPNFVPDQAWTEERLSEWFCLNCHYCLFLCRSLRRTLIGPDKTELRPSTPWNEDRPILWVISAPPPAADNHAKGPRLPDFTPYGASRGLGEGNLEHAPAPSLSRERARKAPGVFTEPQDAQSQNPSLFLPR